MTLSPRSSRPLKAVWKQLIAATEKTYIPKNTLVIKAPIYFVNFGIFPRSLYFNVLKLLEQTIN